MTTIREIARQARVSPATVSRVLNGTAVVDPQTQARVLQVIRETGYRPNEVARSLSKHSSRIMGCIVPNITNPFFTELARAIEDESFRRGYKLILCNSDEDPDKEEAYIDMLERMNADGIIITTTRENIEALSRTCPVPMVILDRAPGVTTATYSVRADHYQGGCLATEYLIRCGCQNIVMMRGPQKYTSAALRHQGYLDVCQKQNLSPQVIDCDFDFNDGLQKTRQLLACFPQVDGILAANDMVALSVIKVLTAEGIRVPEQIQVIGFDNIYLSQLMTPALSTIGQPIAAIGTQAAAIVADLDEGLERPRQSVVLPVELVARETTRHPCGGP
jgi:DNA-binding LacI/PurR family transcriptional regulator